MDTTYDVRVYKTEVHRGARVSSYRVRWKTGGQDWRRSFRNAGQADVFRAELLAAARKGEAFNVATGEPVAWQRDEPGMSWYDFVCAYVDMKWKAASAKYRRAIAQALASATAAMADTVGRPDGQALRSALVNWGYSTKQRNEAPDDVVGILAWLARNTKEVKELADPALSRQLLTAATSRLDGSRAAPTSVRRNRAVLLNALDYAVELKLLDENPVKGIKWRAPKIAHEVDRRVVVNPAQARARVQGRPLATITYRRAWDRGRDAALTGAEYRSPLARRPYDLRHACLSTWLTGGVAATQVAEWAGHSAEMLLRVYAKYLDGQDEIAKRRIAAALGDFNE